MAGVKGMTLEELELKLKEIQDIIASQGDVVDAKLLEIELMIKGLIRSWEDTA